MLDSLFKKVADLQISNFIKSGSNTGLPVNVKNLLGIFFSIEHLWWLLLCLLKREEEESAEQRKRKNF